MLILRYLQRDTNNLQAVTNQNRLNDVETKLKSDKQKLELEQAAESPVEGNVLGGPGGELGRVGGFRHGTDRGYQSRGNCNPLVAEDSGGLYKMGQCFP